VLRDKFSDRPSSAQPVVDLVGGTKKIRVIKKGKRSKKGQQRGVPWPPRPTGATPSRIEPPPMIETAFEEPSEAHMASPPTVAEDDCAKQMFDKHAKSEAAHEQVLECATFVPQKEIVRDTQLRMQDGNGMRHTEQYPMVDLPHASAGCSPRHVPDTSSYLQLNKPRVSFQPDFSASITSHRPTEIALHLPVEHDPREHPVPQPNMRHGDIRHSQRPSNQEKTFTEIGSQVHPVSRNMAHGQHHQQPIEAVLHGSSDLSGPYRVGKAQKKRRVSQQVIASTSFRNSEFFAQTEFDKVLATLSAAHHADQSRKDGDIATQAKHFEEVKALLQDQINQHLVTISEWKDKHAALTSNVVRLQEKAKTNQQYVSGLQKDHEKLQKSVVALQAEFEKALQEIIADAEHDKNSLLHEFNTTLDTLEKGRKNLKGTVDDLYVQLRISESMRRDLAENMTKQVTLYEEEKAKRNDLESRILPSVQDVQRQLNKRSLQLTGTLDRLRNSTDGIVSRLSQDKFLEEYVDTLRKFQKMPFLTSKDVGKSEGMLRFVHDE
jgi:hypothetical protein